LSLRIDRDDICSTWIKSSLSAPGNGPGVGGKWENANPRWVLGIVEVGFMGKPINRTSAELSLELLTKHEYKSEPDRFWKKDLI
jgi:hypothetical protein